jgi:hypothetical protein
MSNLFSGLQRVLDDLAAGAALSEFLIARITEQLAVTVDWPDEPPSHGGLVDSHGHPIYAARRKIAAEVAAVRLLVDHWEACRDISGPGATVYRGAMVAALRCAAFAFSEHPDYRKNWGI